MSNAILTSSQYQNYRRIDLIVIHCSATRATQRYTVDDCRYPNTGAEGYFTETLDETERRLSGSTCCRSSGAARSEKRLPMLRCQQ